MSGVTDDCYYVLHETDNVQKDSEYKDESPYGYKYSSGIKQSAIHACRVCNKHFRASSLLDIHMRIHVGAKPFACPLCNHRATQKGNLKLHMKKHHGADLPPHIDLVPDSGIWGHPENSSTAADKDENGHLRKKIATQSVSELLDEEIVELIRKCQNNVGQGMVGRITESLEDFLQIARVQTGINDSTTWRETVPQSLASVEVGYSHHHSTTQSTPNLCLTRVASENMNFALNYGVNDEQSSYHQNIRDVANIEENQGVDSQMNLFDNNKNCSTTDCIGRKSLPKDVTTHAREQYNKMKLVNYLGLASTKMVDHQLPSVSERKKHAAGLNTGWNERCGTRHVRSHQDPYGIRVSSEYRGMKYPPAETDSQAVKSASDDTTHEMLQQIFRKCHKRSSIDEAGLYAKQRTVQAQQMVAFGGVAMVTSSPCANTSVWTMNHGRHSDIKKDETLKRFARADNAIAIGHKVPRICATVRNEPSPTASCPICGRVSPSAGYLKIHLRSHKKRLEHICNICGRGFKEYWYLNTHLKTHEKRGSVSKLPPSQSISYVRTWEENVSTNNHTYRIVPGTRRIPTITRPNKVLAVFGTMPLEKGVEDYETVDGNGCKCSTVASSLDSMPTDLTKPSALGDNTFSRSYLGTRRRKSFRPLKLTTALDGATSYLTCRNDSTELLSSGPPPATSANAKIRENLECDTWKAKSDICEDMPLDLSCGKERRQASVFHYKYVARSTQGDDLPILQTPTPGVSKPLSTNQRI